MIPFRRVLVLAPHTDDAESGAGGTIARLVSEGAEVYVRVFSSADQSLPEGFSRGITREEQAAASSALGLPDDGVIILNYPVRWFSDHRQDILERMCGMRRDLEPDMVLLPAGCDCHQDHRVIHDEAVRAFKQCSLLGYEMFRNVVDQGFRPGMYCPLTDREMERKVGAISLYRSQAVKRPEMIDLLWFLARIRGGQIGVQFAEAFEVIRWIV